MARARHALEGRSLELIGWMRRSGRLELLLVLPDGSRAWIPAAWTDLKVPRWRRPGRWARLRVCWRCDGCWTACCAPVWRASRRAVSSWPGAMIRSASGMVMQLRLDLAEFPAPAVALWELVGAEQRQRTVTLLAALIAQAVGGEAIGDELASLGGAGAPGGRDD